MNKKLASIALVLTILIGLGISHRAEARTEVTLDVFYDALSPYGEWIEHDYYGYIWQPVGVDEYWQPYRDGNWQYSDEGWIWVSDEPWGWATYHYGRWVPDEYYGWVWIPGVDWAPAYVEWYESPGYIGWSPRPPDRNFFLEIGISFGGYGYYQPKYYGGFNYYKPYYYGGHKHHKKHRRKKHHYYDKHHYHAHAKHSVYVPYEHFSHKNAKLVAIEGSHNTVVYRNTKNINNVTVINNRTVYKGPDRHHVEHRSGKKINRVSVVDRDLVQVRGKRKVNELRGSKYNIYRPKVVKKGHEKPQNILKRYNRDENYKVGNSSQLKKRGVNIQNKDTVVNRDGRNLRNGFNGRQGYQNDGARKYSTKSNKSRRNLSPAKNQKQEINKSKISTRYQGSKQSQLKKKGINTENKDTVINRGPRNLRNGFNGRESYRNNGARKYSTKSNKSKPELSPAKNQKQGINKSKISTHYQGSKRSQLNRNTDYNPRVNKSRNQHQYNNKPKGSKLSGKSDRNLVSPRNQNAKSVKNNRKPYKAPNKSLRPAKTQRSQAAYKTKKPNVGKAQKRQKSFNSNRANQRVQKRSKSVASSYRKASKKSSSKTTTTRNVTNRNFNTSFKGSQSRVKSSANKSFNRQARR